MAMPHGYPLDYRSGDYRYIERPNSTLVSLVERHVFRYQARARILDIGAGAGATLRALRALSPTSEFTAVEPNPRAQVLLKQACDHVYEGTLEEFLRCAPPSHFDAVVLSDVVEHVADPVTFLSALVRDRCTAGALFFVSIPNFAVWYNRVSTLLGRFEYSWSGLRDRTHLRFFTRASQTKLFDHVELEVIEQRATPSLVQSLAPWLRRSFEDDVAAGQHLSLDQSPLYRRYRESIEPLETRLCELWPELLGFQIVSVLRRR
jgi:SAM-dependent methyltransferase